MTEYRFDVCGDVVTLLTKAAGALDASLGEWDAEKQQLFRGF